ncbi:hypothetical protein PARU111607_15935 [Palleronia rufa]
MRAVAHGEDRRIAGPKGLVHGHIAPVQRQPGLGQPAVGPRAGRAGDEPGRDLAPIGQHHRAGRQSRHLLALDQRHARFGHRPPQPVRGAAAQSRQRPVALDHRHRPPAGPVAHGHRQFHPGDPAADHRDGVTPIPDRRPACREPAQRLGGDAMFGKARQVRHLRMDPDVERGHVIADPPRPDQPVVDGDFPRRRVQPRGPSQDQPRAGEARQPHQVDLQRVAVVMAGDEARQHPGVGRRRAGIDDRQPRARQRIHPPAPQHQRMGVTAADQHDVSGQGQGGGQHGRSVSGHRL